MDLFLADLIDLALILIVILVCVGIALIFNGAANSISGIPLVGGYIAGWLQGAANDIISWCYSATRSLWHVLADSFRIFGYLFNWITSNIAGAFYNVWNQLYWVWNTGVESVRSQVENDVNNAVNVASAATAAALVTSEHYTNHIYNEATGALNTTQDWITDTIVPEVEAFATTTAEAGKAALKADVEAQAAALTAGLALVWDAIDPLQTAVSTTLPAEIAASGAGSKAAGLAEANAKIVTLQTQIATANANIASLQSQIASAGSTATAGLAAQLAQVQSQLAAAQAQATATAATAASAASGEATTATEAAGAVAAAAAAQAAVVTLTGQVETLEAQVEAGAAEATASLQAQVTQLQGQVSQYTSSLATLQATTTIAFPDVGAFQAAGAITVPLAVSALAVTVANVATEVDDCMVSTCEGPNNWQSLLNGALGAVDIVSLLTFLSAVATNPAGTASEVADLGEGLYGAGHALIDDLLSI